MSVATVTIIGQSVLIRTYALPTILYLATVFAVPELIIWETLYMPFFKRSKIPCIKKYITAIRTKWIKDITNPSCFKPWIYLVRYYVETPLSMARPA